MMKKPGIKFYLMPVLGLLALAGAGVDLAHRPHPDDAMPYHTEVRAAAEHIPGTVGLWTWDTSVTSDDRAAKKLLKPNVLVQRTYREQGTGRSMDFLLDQCIDARNMAGHYPPYCYAGQGRVLTVQTPMTFTIKGDGDAETTAPLKIAAMEYVFTDKRSDSRMVVVNFLILPCGLFATDIGEVDSAAADFGRRFYGAGQVQMVFDFPPNISGSQMDDMRAENRETVKQFLSANCDLLRLMYSGGRR